MADETTQEVTIKILGEAESFKKSVKEATQLTTDLNKLSKQYQKSGMGQHKALGKITGKHQKSQKKAGKEAFMMEKKLAKAIKANVKEIQKQQKAFKGNALAIKEELKALRDLEKQHRKIAKFRKGTGYKSMGERFGGGARRMGKGMSGGMKGIGQGVMALGGMIMGAVTAIVGTLISTVTSQIRQGYASYINFGRSRAGLGGMGALKGSGRSFGVAQRLGFSKTETVQQMRGVGRATGNINAVNTAQIAARSFGGDVSQVTGLMGTMTKGGQGFGGMAGRGGSRQLRQVMSHAFTAGLDKSRAGEHLSAVAQGIKSAQTVTGGKVDASQISAMLSMFGRSGQPGLQGAAGMQQLTKLDSVIKRAGFGGGDAMSSLLYQSQGFGTPGGNTSFYDATKQLQRGVFGEGGAGNLMKMFGRASQVGGGQNTQRTNELLSSGTGLSLDVVESIWKVIEENGGNTEAATAAIAEITKQELPIQKQLLNATKGGHLKVAARVAKLENRLIQIGADNAEAIEEIQDVINEVVDTLMPVAVEALKIIAEVVRAIWDWLRDFGADWREAEGIGEELNSVEKERNKILKQVESGTMTGQEGRSALLKLAERAGSGEMALRRDVNPLVAFAESAGHMYHRAGQVTGLIGEDEMSSHQRRQATANRAARTRSRMQRTAQATGSGWVGQAAEFEAERLRNRMAVQGESPAAREARQERAAEARANRDRVQQELMNVREHGPGMTHPGSPLMDRWGPAGPYYDTNGTDPGAVRAQTTGPANSTGTPN